MIGPAHADVLCAQFLPTSSPDFSPIEHVFSKFKERLRRLAAHADDALRAAITDALATSTASDATHCFRHCSYPLEHQPL